MVLTELEARGWECIPGISTRADLFTLASSLGRIVPSPTGEVVKELTPRKAEKARPGTLSATHGLDQFPFHTDTAFWPVPARYVVMRVVGDTRRPTIVWPFIELLRMRDSGLTALAERSIWLARTSQSRFYCSMRFRCSQGTGWRYDGHCMIPANRAAMEIEELLRPLVSSGGGDIIRWSREEAVVLANWKVLHARGQSPQDEGTRSLERIYVR
jgi:hypothetical protein